MRSVLSVLRTNAAVPAALALVYAYFAYRLAGDAADVGARLVVQPGADRSEWLGEIVRNFMLSVGVVTQTLWGLLGALVAWVVSGPTERGRVRHGLWLWAAACALVVGLSAVPVNSVAFFLKQGLVFLLSLGSAWVLWRHTQARWRARAVIGAAEA